jgi:hypothetical protein
MAAIAKTDRHRNSTGLAPAPLQGEQVCRQLSPRTLDSVFEKLQDQEQKMHESIKDSHIFRPESYQVQRSRDGIDCLRFIICRNSFLHGFAPPGPSTKMFTYKEPLHASVYAVKK